MTLHEASFSADIQPILLSNYTNAPEDLSAVSTETLAQISNILCLEPYFIPRSSMQLMNSAVEAIEFVLSSSRFVDFVLKDSEEIAQFDSGVRGVFYGYDFHIGSQYPKLIEINSNAGGPLISSYQSLLREKLDVKNLNYLEIANISRQERTFVEMFFEEWQLFSKTKNLKTIAIVDIYPEKQFLKNEFLLFSELFRKFGITAFILDPRDLVYNGAEVLFGSTKIDMIYNRMTDFYFTEVFCSHLKDAYLNSSIAVTPNPRSHAIYANKRNLVYLSDRMFLHHLGVPQEYINTLTEVIPKTVAVTQFNAAELWDNRRRYFFKPVTGYGGKAVYRGDKLTRTAWENITASNSYIAQEFVPPGEKLVKYNNQQIFMKADVRNYVYNRKIQLTSARLYQGQTTNFRTPGGGFAIVVPVDDLKATQLNLTTQDNSELLPPIHRLTGVH
jgi:hypothetical protein